jgi:hypothetical protein
VTRSARLLGVGRESTIVADCVFAFFFFFSVGVGFARFDRGW